MKKTAIAVALLCVFTGQAAADDSVNSDDPCAQFLCLAGMISGENPAECNGAYRSFMSIKKKKHGDFLPDHTADARKDKLDECPTADGGIIEKIIIKFGRKEN